MKIICLQCKETIDNTKKTLTVEGISFQAIPCPYCHNIMNAEIKDRVLLEKCKQIYKAAQLKKKAEYLKSKVIVLKLIEIRKKRCIERREILEMIEGLSKQRLSSLEKGSNTNITIKRAVQLANALNCSLDELIKLMDKTEYEELPEYKKKQYILVQ